MTELQEATPFVTAEDRSKANVLRLLVTPLDEIAGLFMAAFKSYKPILSKVSVLEGTVLITIFATRPMSDIIRETVFNIYNRHWGGKPDDIECVYKDAIGFVGCENKPVALYVTVRPESVTKLIRDSKAWRVLDFSAFDEWANDLPPKHWPGAKSKDKVLVKDEGKRHTVTVYENGLSGEPIPTVRHALFKV